MEQIGSCLNLVLWVCSLKKYIFWKSLLRLPGFVHRHRRLKLYPTKQFTILSLSFSTKKVKYCCFFNYSNTFVIFIFFSFYLWWGPKLRLDIFYIKRGTVLLYWINSKQQMTTMKSNKYKIDKFHSKSSFDHFYCFSK